MCAGGRCAAMLHFVPRISPRTDRPTERQTDRNTHTQMHHTHRVGTLILEISMEYFKIYMHLNI